MKPLKRMFWSGRIQRLIPPARFSLALVFTAVLGLPSTAHSATNIVTSLADNAAGSLRQTIANSMPRDSIVFNVGGTITLTSGELTITKDLNVNGPGASALAISGAGATRIFSLNSNISVSISDLTLCNGRTPDGVAGTVMKNGGTSAPGGAMFTAGSLTLMNCVITANQTGNGGDGFSPPIPPYLPHTPPTSGGASGNGGAIYNSGTLCVSNCVIADNATGHGGGRAHNDTYWSSSGTAGSGGAIYNVGTLTLIHSTVSGNRTGAADGSGASGGGVWNGGNFIASHCVISNNATASSGGLGYQGGEGGGICSQGLLGLTNCTVSGNWCGGGSSPSDCFPPGAGCGGGMGGSGGGIHSANCVLVGCTINDNCAGGGGLGGFAYVPPYSGGTGGSGGNGGGVCLNGTFAFLTNCTITGNSAGSGGNGGFAMSGMEGSGGNGGNGGGIYWWGSTQVVVASTIVSNSVGGAGGGYLPGAVGNGGGIFAYGGALGGLQDNIVARNAGPSPDVSGPFTSLGYNLIGITNGSSGFTAGGDLVGSSGSPLDPQTAPLTDNGGPTWTMALLPGSPAIEAGTMLGVPATDQRGVARPQGAVADIGAYEFEFTPQIISARFQPPSVFWVKSCGLPNHSYALQASTNLLDWFEVTNRCTGANGLCEFTCPDAGDSNRRFFRTKALLSP